MEISIPAIPLGVLTLLAFFAPYSIALVIMPSWLSKWKRLVSIVVTQADYAFVLKRSVAALEAKHSAR